MKKTLFFVFMLMLAYNGNAQKKETAQQAVDYMEKVKADFARHEAFRKSTIKRGYSNDIDADVKKDSAQFYVGGRNKDTIFISKNGLGISYDTGTIIYTDKRSYLLPGQMGLWLKERQFGNVAGSTRTLWITFQSNDGFVSLPFNPEGDAANNIFVLAGNEVVDTNGTATYSFENKNGKVTDKYELIRGVGSPLIIQMDVNSDYKEVLDLKIGKPNRPTVTASKTDIEPAAKPVQH